MRMIDIDEGKKICADILHIFADYCDEHNLQYYLAYGTLIGAVRHKGYIPWDDDIDVHMPRPDYEKLLALFNTDMAETDYLVIRPSDERGYHTWAKLINKKTLKVEKGVGNGIGLDIDIFPLDGVPDTYDDFVKHYDRLHRAQYLYLVKHVTTDGRNLLQRIALTVVKVFLPKKSVFLRFFDKQCLMFDYDKCTNVGVVSSYYCGKKNYFKREQFGEGKKLEFEGKWYNVPNDYDGILTHIYGDYMTPPPENERVTHHYFEAYWVE